jgi:hypothetical protein
LFLAADLIALAINVPLIFYLYLDLLGSFVVWLHL